MSAAHLALVRQLPSAVSPENRSVQAHHLCSGPARAERGVGLKATDQWLVPLDSWRHADLHALGSRHELAWFMESAINPYALARALWLATGDRQRMARVLLAHKLAAIPLVMQMRKVGITQIRAPDLQAITSELTPAEWIDVTPRQVIAALAMQRGLVVRLPRGRPRDGRST